MLLHDFIDPGDPILNWQSFFKVAGRMSRRAYWRASWSLVRWTFGAALFFTALSTSLGALLGGLIGMLIGSAIGIVLGALFQAIPVTALQIQRLHDFGWSAKILILLFSLILGPLLLSVGVIATRFSHQEAIMPWLTGCPFAGVAAYIALGWILLGAEAPKKENRFGPPPED